MFKGHLLCDLRVIRSGLMDLVLAECNCFFTLAAGFQ